MRELPDLRLSWAVRILLLVSGAGVLALLVTARCLQPAERGFGTHQQLGLPPCTSVALFGSACPACGMTTSWALTTRGELRAAIQANAGGFLLAIIGLAYLPASCYFFIGGRTSRCEWYSLALGISLLTSLVVAVVQWVFRFY